MPCENTVVKNGSLSFPFLDFAPATANIGEETPDGRFTISWSRPSGFQFLVQYVVNIFQTTLRRTVPVPRDDTSYDFQADPFTQYMVDVSGDFDVNGTTFSDPVAAPVTFQSIEQGDESFGAPVLLLHSTQHPCTLVCIAYMHT